ncbi:MAG: MarR family winged helix-turn-helix transcriptional regulator [Lautropia sp.]
MTELALLVFRLNGTLLQWGDALVEPLGLTSARWQVLGAIALAAKALTAPQVGQAMGVTRQGAQKQLNLLLDLGLIESHSNPAHQRSPLYALTPRGQRLYQQAVMLWMDRAAEMVARLSPAKVREARTTLEAMLRHLSTRKPETDS